MSTPDTTPAQTPASPSKPALYTGLALSYLPCLMLLLAASMSLSGAKDAVEGMAQYGWPPETATPLGSVLLLSTIIYMLPRTSILGAILLTGWLGGAVSTHMRAQDPPLQIVFPALFGAILWLGLYLRYPILRTLIPFKR